MLFDLTQMLSRFLSVRMVKTAQNRRPRTSRRKLPVEALEMRTMLASPTVAAVMGGTAGTGVVGTVYEDLDSNGAKSPGENGVSGVTVYLDLDNSGTLNNDAAGVLEPSALTNVDGDFVINHLKPGTYRVSEVTPAGWTPTAVVSQDVVVLNDKDTKADFFNFAGGDVVGTVWNDLNHDGVRGVEPATGEFTEPGLADWTVFLDLNNSFSADPGEPTTQTDLNGNYAFHNIPAGDYEVTEVLPAGWEATKKNDIRQTASVVALGQTVQDFGNLSLVNGSIQGTVWNDTNGNGNRETDPATGAFIEPGLENWTVFLDTNNNGSPDPSEMTTTTDADGHYSFISLPAGDYEVTEVLPSGWSASSTFDVRQTVAVFAGESSTAGDFANFTVLNGSIRGTIWNDRYRDGTRDKSLAGAFTDPGLENWQVFVDLNRNRLQDAGEPVALSDVNGDYTFSDLQVGDYEVQEILPSGWEVTEGYGDSQTVTVFSGAESRAGDFANFNLSTAIPGTVSGVVWNDLNGNGVRETNPTTGAFADPGLADRIVFVDLNGNGILDIAEPNTKSAADGSYAISGVNPGTVSIVEVPQAGWRATAPMSGSRSVALKNGGNVGGLDFGNYTLQESAIRGTIFADSDQDGTRDAGERGLAGITVYLDTNNNSVMDVGEAHTTTSSDQFFTPTTDETGAYSFTHLAQGSYTVRSVLPETLSATPSSELTHSVTIAATEDHSGIDTAAVFRPNEIHGVKFDDTNGNHLRDAGEAGVAGVTIYLDIDRDDVQDPSEPQTLTAADGSYSFGMLTAGAYVVREVLTAGHEHTYPMTSGGTLWPSGVSNAAVGNVTPSSITTSLAAGQTHRVTVSITLPNTGALTNLVDVFLLFDDTGSFVNNSPIVRGAFPAIISQLQAALPGTDLGFGVGRFEEYANFAYEYATGRPFILNQPIVAASTPGYMSSIQAALDRTTPGYGGDQPETDIEALYQLVTGVGFDGNNNGTVLDSGVAGLASTQLNPGNSGDVPSFASFLADPAHSVMTAAGNVGGGGFRAGALPIILTATDTGFAYQPMGESNVTGAGGVTLPVSALTGTDRPTTPFNSGAGLQETVTALNALGALVIGLGTNPQANLDPRQGLEALSTLTGATNHSTTTIANGTSDAIAPGDPLYFQIASGFASSVADGVVSAIRNAATNVAVDITVQASDPRVRIVNHSGVKNSIGSGQSAMFDIEIIGDGTVHRFDLQFVRAGTNVVLGSIPVVLGTPVPGEGYEFEDCAEGEIHHGVDFGSHETGVAISKMTVSGGTYVYDGTAHAATATVTGTDGTPVSGTYALTYNGSTTPPTNAGVYNVVATFTSSDPNYANATGTATLTVTPSTPSVTVNAGAVTFDGSPHAATATATGVGGVAVSGTYTFTYNGLTSLPTSVGSYDVVASFTSSDPNYANATGTATLLITAPAAVNPSLTAEGGIVTYDGAAHVATAIATGTGGVAVSGTYSFTYSGSSTPPTNAGTYDVLVTFTSTDPLYNDVTGTATLTISAVTPSVTVNADSVAYYGSTHVATATAVGVGGTAVSGSYAFTYNGSAIAPTDAGIYDIVATFTSSDPNYANATGTATLTIVPATPGVTVQGGTATYDGTPHAATATASGVGGIAVSGTYAFTYNGSAFVPINSGVYDVLATFTSSDSNYANATGTATITILPATAVLMVTGGTATYDGTQHTVVGSATGIGAAAIAGSFTYTYDGSPTPPVNAGAYTVVGTFASADPNYADGVVNGTLTITPATPSFSRLSAPTISSSTAITTLVGHLAAGSVVPAGSTVSITVNGVTQTGIVNSAGDFSTTFSTALLDPGTYPIQYAFAGDGANFAAATTANTMLTVSSTANTTTKLTSSTGVSVTRQYITFTSVIANGTAGGGVPTGTVTFIDGKSVLGTATLVNGVATLATPLAGLGKHTVVATYSGDASHLKSSTTLSQSVMPVALEPTSVAGEFVLFVAGTASNRDKLQIETQSHGKVDTYNVHIDATGIPTGPYHYQVQTTAPGKIVQIVIYGVGTNESVELNTNGSKIPAYFYGGPGNNTFVGGSGNNVLIGGAGNNVLTGGAGRNLLIAGAGRSTLNAGKGDTILIGGRTSYDIPTPGNLAAVKLIMAEWGSTAALDVRIAHLTGTLAGGLNQSSVLNNTTVQDNGLQDTLNGGKGEDWYLARAGKDQVKAKKAKYRVTNL